MRRGNLGKLVLVGAGILLAGGLSAVAASASPTCSTIQNLGTAGAGVIAKSSFTSGFCVQANDKIYGNFHLGNLPTSTVVIFNLNTVNSLSYYQIAFSGTFHSGTTYNWNYEVAVAASAPPLTSIIGLQSDFSQTAGGLSTLNESTNPLAISSATIHMQKNSSALLLTGKVSDISYTAGTVTDLIVNLHLVDHGTISSVTNTIIQQGPGGGGTVPEPLSLSLFGAGLAGLGMVRRKRRG